MQVPPIPGDNIYLRLTREFNAGRLRAIICGGQAVVLHKIAIMSKDGDWILREDEEALAHVRSVLSSLGARYRFGAPLDTRWMEGGWSAHFEFTDSLRIRTDFFTRPPRLSAEDVQRIWTEQERRPHPFLDPPDLAEMKKTNREKDYVVIGELGRIMRNPADQLLYSRSARDILAIARSYPALPGTLAPRRPLLNELEGGEEHLARLLDEERRILIRRNERRLQRHVAASRRWADSWPAISARIVDMTLHEAHQFVVEAALDVLPFKVEDHSDE